METNEKLKLALVQETEKELLKMIEQGETRPEGDRQTLEQSVLRACLCLGRTMMEQILNQSAQEAERPSRREGACGDQPRLVGRRPKQLHPLMGKVTIGRSSYHCMGEEEDPSGASAMGLGRGTNRRTNPSRSPKPVGQTGLSSDPLAGRGHLH
jgi:hypothetical protein